MAITYGFWNPNPDYGEGFSNPGPLPHGSLGPKQTHIRNQNEPQSGNLCRICSSTLLLSGKAFDTHGCYINKVAVIRHVLLTAYEYCVRLCFVVDIYIYIYAVCSLSIKIMCVNIILRTFHHLE